MRTHHVGIDLVREVREDAFGGVMLQLRPEGEMRGHLKEERTKACPGEEDKFMR